MRLTETQEETMTQSNATETKTKLPVHHDDARKLRKAADSLELEQYVSPEGRSGALKLLGRLRKWETADPEHAETHAQAISWIEQIAEGNRRLADYLESLPADYNPGPPRRTKREIAAGLPVRILEKDVELFAGLIDDPKCLKVVAIRKRQAFVETVTHERFWIDNKYLEVIE